MLTNVQPSDSGSSYFAKVSNVAGSATSQPATLQVGGAPPVLRVDVGLTGSVNLQPGYSLFTLVENPATFGNITMEVTGLGGATLFDRNRATPVNNPPLLTQAQIYQDFVFANGTTDGTGLRINLSG